MLLLCIILLLLATMPSTNQLHGQKGNALIEGLIQRGSNINNIQYQRAVSSDSGNNKNKEIVPLTFVAAQASDELPTPSMPALTFINIRSVNISWEFDYSAISAAQNVCFVIEYQNNTRYANVSSMICNHTFFVFPYLLRGEQYRFRIYATDGVTSTVSNWTFMFINGIEAPPGPPKNFRAKVFSDTEIQLLWDNFILLSDSPVAYDICFGVEPTCVDGPTIFVQAGNSQDIVALLPSTTYYFEIRAFLGPFNSIWSDWITATTHSSTLPVVVLKNNFKVSSTFVFIQWEPIQKDNLPQTFREYYVAIGKRIMDLSTKHYNYTTSNTSFNVTDLQPNTFYYLAVGYYVTDSEGTMIPSGLSDIINVTTLPLYHPPVIWCTNCKGLSKDTIQISWEVTSDDDSVIESYVIYNKTDGGEYMSVGNISDVTTTVFNITGLHPNRGYSYYVQAIGYKANGTKVECPETACRTKQAVPDPPSNVQLSAVNSTSVLVSWDEPIDNKGVITQYVVHYFCTNTTRCDDDKQLSTANRHLLVTGLYPYTEYTFVICGHTIVGNGEYSRPMKIRTKEAAPDGPPRSFLVDGNFPTSLSLQWSPPLLEHQNGIIVGYQVSWKLPQEGQSDAPLGTATTESTTYTIVDLDSSTIYNLSVAAFTKVGIGPAKSIEGKTTNSDYNLDFSWTLVPSTANRNCLEIKFNWNPLSNKDFLYIIRISPFEEDEIITPEWNITAQSDSVTIPRSQMVEGIVYEAELEVVIGNADPSSSEVITTTEPLNVTLQPCYNPNGTDLGFSSTLVQSKNCKDIQLHWNLFEGDDLSYFISISSVELKENIWNITTQNDSVIIPRSELEEGKTYTAELEVVVEDTDSPIQVSRPLNITLPACSKPKDATLLWSCLGGGIGLVLLVLLTVWCFYLHYRWQKFKLLQQVRRPVGGENLSEDIKEEEATLLGQATNWGGSNSTISSSENSNDSSDVPMLRVEESDTQSDEISNLGDISLMERPLPIGAEDS